MKKLFKHMIVEKIIKTTRTKKIKTLKVVKKRRFMS